MIDDGKIFKIDSCHSSVKEMNLKNQKKKYFPEIFFYNVQTDEWFTNKSDHVNEPDPRYKHSAVVYKNLMIIHGGVSAITEAILNDTWCFNFNDGKWSLINNDSKIFVSRFEHAAVHGRLRAYRSGLGRNMGVLSGHCV